MAPYIEDWLKRESNVSQYRQGLAYLHSSGILNVMRKLAAPAVAGIRSDLNASAAAAHQSAGYNACLDTLEYFVELYGAQGKTSELKTPDFGGLQAALEKGVLTKEEVDKLSKTK